MRSILVLGALVATLVTACSSPVTGSAAGSATESSTTETSTAVTSTTGTSTRTTSARVTTKRATTTTATSYPPMPTIDESAPAQYCDKTFRGALGKDMLAVVVDTPAGRLTCDQAAAILFDYYTARPTPRTGLAPHLIGPMRCNQVLEPALPQVVCTDDENLVYSMWPQR
ncbi:hypothetical protein [Actinokineospora inagensis]|uniref:hypothetical protein n=1 Tax=Actinokineospora inagensis TaxID=103730 RepID=UPI00047B62D4|nr:hypothetical protein [Actinokineospora inagensis]